MEHPQTKKDAWIFQGMAEYYRRFICDFATIAKPLTNLMKKNRPNQVEWTQEAESTFPTLKRALTSSTFMCNPDFNKTFELRTDANSEDVYIRAVLSQNDRPIAYFNGKLLDQEKRYSTVGQECLAIVTGIKAFKTYLLGKPFILQTDHWALWWLQQFHNSNSRLMRRSLMLQLYTYTVHHKKGKDNANTDGLSRLVTMPRT